jgi:GDYXXLXY protein
MKIWLRIAALSFPVVALAASWAFTHNKAQQGTIWAVPIRGYDPRDLLRGHYITYRYEWPGLAIPDERQYIGALCIKGAAPTIDTATIVDQFGQQEALSKTGCTVIAHSPPESDSQNGLSDGKIYIAQTKAAELERKLFDPKLKAYVHIRIRDDGIITPIELIFRTRPVALPR